MNDAPRRLAYAKAEWRSLAPICFGRGIRRRGDEEAGI
jgi:hypothetical protein